MYFDDGPAPIDSYDLYAMGLRSARCNGCKYNQIKHELGNKFLELQRNNKWVNVYELDSTPLPGQADPKEYEGRPIRFTIGFAGIGHTDECYHWQPPGGLT